MNQPLVLAVCAGCGYAAFPQRLLCPRCGGRRWHSRAAREGFIEATTTLRRGPGRDYDPPVALALVRLADGPLVVARLERDAPSGDAVALALDSSGAPVARAGSR